MEVGLGIRILAVCFWLRKFNYKENSKTPWDDFDSYAGEPSSKTLKCFAVSIKNFVIQFTLQIKKLLLLVRQSSAEKNLDKNQDIL